MRNAIMAAGLLLAGVSSSAVAADGWVISEKGAVPDREITVIRDEEIQNKTKAGDDEVQPGQDGRGLYQRLFKGWKKKGGFEAYARASQPASH